MRHHWVKGINLSYYKETQLLIHFKASQLIFSIFNLGNLPAESTCHVCEEECGNDDSNVSDYRCGWCQWTVHEKCQANLSDLCNLGVYRNFIIPPNCIKLKTRGRLRSQCLVSSIREPQWGDQWKPLIVIGKLVLHYCPVKRFDHTFYFSITGNAKSGSNEACHILSSARSILNAVQAIDLSDQEPKVALQLCTLLKETQCRLLIAGGDGTIAWVLNAVQELQVKVGFPSNICMFFKI